MVHKKRRSSGQRKNPEIFALQTKISSPLGDLFLVATERGLCSISWEKQNIPFLQNLLLSAPSLVLLEHMGSPDLAQGNAFLFKNKKTNKEGISLKNKNQKKTSLKNAFYQEAFSKIKDHLALSKKELFEYFNGKRNSFDIPLDLRGTDFQKSVWKSLQKIPYGETISYKTLATRLKSKAYRAVGSANGRNPLPIIIPCHRVIATGGGLGGYTGGLRIKKFLLSLEQL